MGTSGELFISTRNQYVDKQVVPHLDLKPGNYAVVHIEDTGGGISEQDLERIFEPFYSKKVMGRSGTGLGLTVVWNTMQDHNGVITVASSATGTIFELYFPVTEQERDDSTKQEKILPRGHGEKILVVDDVEEQRDIACRMLQQLGYTVYTVSSGDEAVSWMERNSVDLVLLDMIMPGMSGRETYEAILQLHPGQKAIVASGFSESTDVKTTLNLGAGAFIKKPYSMGQLGQAVFQTLNKQVNQSG
jgi:CheY-like chemotaxis protein